MSPVERARSLIYSNGDIIEVGEQIKENLEEEEEEINIVIVLAELYYKAGLKERAKKELGGYKKTLDPKMQAAEIKQINKAIEVVKNSKTQKLNWDILWDQRHSQGDDEINNNASIIQAVVTVPEAPEAPTSPGDDGGR